MLEQSGQLVLPGVLYVVATPIGNLEDITLRAVRILSEVALIAAEDTRHTRKLLSHLNIHTPMISYFKDREMAKAGPIVDQILTGRDVALVSDAGTPAISDPGAILVARAVAAGIRVIPIPGPSALTAAISVAGFSGQNVLFIGFLPTAKGERTKMIRAIRDSSAVTVFYETARRILATLDDCIDILGDRSICLARELTKIHEEIINGPLSKAQAILADRPVVKGEFVVVLEGGADRAEVPDETIELPEVLRWYREQGDWSMRDAVRKVAADLGVSRSEVYTIALEVWQG
ncbi:MAG: 16S rRNA (cytidine(1402)-2'-O)-methyltransferase [Proteobacteria bacterium]|nr:16S rRNA (cytidine(1402)-2'-O)-methyltransferase [Pseudomonadota bacterium]MBU1686837.1 16S rRNA (cytidine(1402)-2'-O)-methyltransferase [Pseudomonadota bacterium]